MLLLQDPTWIFDLFNVQLLRRSWTSVWRSKVDLLKSQKMSLFHCQSHCTFKTLSGNFCKVMFLGVSKFVREEFHISLVICLAFQHIYLWLTLSYS